MGRCCRRSPGMDGEAYISLPDVNQLITPLRPGPNGRNSSFVAMFHPRTICNP
jgi:hypothetical protein